MRSQSYLSKAITAYTLHACRAVGELSVTELQLLFRAPKTTIYTVLKKVDCLEVKRAKVIIKDPAKADRVSWILHSYRPYSLADLRTGRVSKDYLHALPEGAKNLLIKELKQSYLEDPDNWDETWEKYLYKLPLEAVETFKSFGVPVLEPVTCREGGPDLFYYCLEAVRLLLQRGSWSTYWMRALHPEISKTTAHKAVDLAINKKLIKYNVLLDRYAVTFVDSEGQRQEIKVATDQLREQALVRGFTESPKIRISEFEQDQEYEQQALEDRLTQLALAELVPSVAVEFTGDYTPKELELLQETAPGKWWTDYDGLLISHDPIHDVKDSRVEPGAILVYFKELQGLAVFTRSEFIQKYPNITIN